MKEVFNLYASMFMYDFFYNFQMSFNLLSIVLKQGYKYVLTKETPDLPAANTLKFNL